jgi:hypothetical protein
MHLVQLLLPLYDNAGQPIPRELLGEVRQELVDRFGGLTAYTRAPAKGLWEDPEGEVARDDIVVYEVMVDKDLDAGWWAAYREGLCRRFGQKAMVVRAWPVQAL